MFGLGKTKKTLTEMPAKKSFFASLRDGLKRTRSNLTEGLSQLILGKKTIDEELFQELETRLLLADVGIETTQEIIEHLTQQLKRKELKDPQTLLTGLKQELINTIKPCQQPLVITETSKPFMILMVGINGAGKTTTIGKLAHRLQAENKKILLAAGDTFRAAAVEQLQIWGERNQIPVIAQPTGADSASVIYDAMTAARARQMDVLIADTAGRLHTQSNLMDELKKIKRVITKLDANAPHETLLVLDGSIGQNALRQASEFHQAIGVTGLVITKLDGTAKGGILFAIAKQMKLPIRYIGIGEAMNDLQPFDAEAFVAALFEDKDI